MTGNLNENVLDDLELEGANLPSGVFLPGTADATQGEAVVKVPSDELVDAEPHEKDAIVKELLDKEVIFEVIGEDVHDVIEMQEIEESILGDKVIDRSGAESINMAFEGFLGDKLSLAEFTHLPTRTNYQYSINYMGQRIAQEKQSIVAKCQEPLREFVEMVSASVESMVGSTLPKLDEAIYAIHSKLELLDLNPKDLILPTDSAFVDMYKSELGSEEGIEAKFVSVDMGLVKFDVRSALKKLSQVEDIINESKELRYLLTKLVEGSNTAEIVSNHNLAHGSDYLSLEVLIKAFLTEEMTELVSTYIDLLNERKEHLNKAPTQMGDEYSTIEDYILKHGVEAIEDSYWLRFIMSTSMALSMIVGPLADVLEVLEQQR